MKIDGALKVKNKNFICQRMNARDIKEAFYVDRKDFMDFVYDMIGAGYLQKVGDRYFRPTQKLIDEVLLPENGMYYIEAHQRRILSFQSSFYFNELISVFDGKEYIANAMIRFGYFKISADKRYRKTDEFAEFLADGGDTVKVKECLIGA